MSTPIRPCAVPLGHSLFSVTVTTTRTVEERLLVAASDLREARREARIHSDPDWDDCCDEEAWTQGGDITPDDLVDLLAEQDADARIRRMLDQYDAAVIAAPPGFRGETCPEPRDLLLSFADPEALERHRLALKEANNGQLALLEVPA